MNASGAKRSLNYTAKVATAMNATESMNRLIQTMFECVSDALVGMFQRCPSLGMLPNIYANINTFF